MNKQTQINDKQQQVLDILMDIMNYHKNSIDGLVEPEEVFESFVKKYIFIEEGSAKGYKDPESLLTKDFEKTLFFSHICSFLRNKNDKSYLIDNQISTMLQVLSIPYKFNHFDPRIYNYLK
jgi:hypothetical protein